MCYYRITALANVFFANRAKVSPEKSKNCEKNCFFFVEKGYPLAAIELYI